jgi:DNA-binding transcriptional ArsR family regulator
VDGDLELNKLIEEQCAQDCPGTELDPKLFSDAKVDEAMAVTLSNWFKALSDPTRIKMIYALLNRELCVHDISMLLQMEQSAVSHQLRYLRDARMVKRRKEGNTVYYSLDDDHVDQVFKQTLQHLKHE